MRVISLALSSIVFSLALSFSPSLFRSLPRSFTLSHALSLSFSLFRSLLRSFSHSLTQQRQY